VRAFEKNFTKNIRIKTWALHKETKDHQEIDAACRKRGILICYG
jgi:hypothetical protein